MTCREIFELEVHYSFRCEKHYKSARSTSAAMHRSVLEQVKNKTPDGAGRFWRGQERRETSGKVKSH